MNNKRITNLLYFIFFISGISGLIYETVWLRVLSRILGSTVEASSITISAFMLGLTAGSYFIGIYISDIKRKVRLYAILEIGISLTAIAVYFMFNQLVPLYQLFYHMTNGNTLIYRFLQAIVLFLLIVLPTFQMGATLPVLSSAILKFNPNFTKTMGYLYGLNTFGAVVGVFLSGFFTLGSIGEYNTILIGVLFNIIAGTTVYFIVSKKESFNNFSLIKGTQKKENHLISEYPATIRKLSLIAYWCIGFTAFAMEVIWIRLFMLPLGTAIYSFSIVMTIYLSGSAIGSYIFGKYFARITKLLEIFGFLLIGIGIYGVIGMYIFSAYVPWQFDTIVMVGPGKIINAVFVIFPITLVLGFLFPLIAKIYVPNKEETGNRVGRLYASNTLGCIFGSILCGYVFIPTIGTKGTIICIGVIDVVIGMIILLSENVKYSKVIKLTTIISSFLLISILSYFSPDPFLTVVNKGIKDVLNSEIWYNKETTAATITICGTDSNNRQTKQLFINGSSMTLLVSETKILAHLPLLLHPNPKNMLIICYGMGTVLRSAVTHKNVDIDVVELVGEEFECGHFFHSNASEVLANEQVHHFAEDGRNFLLMNDKKKYDVIIVDPAPPLWSAGTVNLYTLEFFALCKQRLSNNGILCFWIPPDRSSEVKMIMKSYMSVFPDAEVYRGLTNAGFYMMGYKKAYPPDIRRFDSAKFDPGIMADLNEWDSIAAPSPSTLLWLKVATSSQLNKFLIGTKEVSDKYPYTEFPLWRKYYDPEFDSLLDARVLATKF